MARRRNASPAEDFMDLVAMAPWWVGVALAAVCYPLLHRFAVLPQVTSLQPGQAGDFAQRAIVATLASVGQVIVPVLCLAGSLISFLKQRKRRSLAQAVASSSAPQSLNGMSWQEFEILVGEAFRQRGYLVAEAGGSQPDGGVDLVLRRGKETFLVQCKQWKALKVGVGVVRELYGVMAARGAAGGFVVTSGTFTPDAQEFAAGRNLTLVEGETLFEWIRTAKVSPACSPSSQVPQSPRAESPVCPKCESRMVRRKATKGANAGGEFWGCPRFPACKGTR